MLEHEVDFVGSDLLCGDNQVAFVLSVFVVNDNHELSLSEVLDGFLYRVKFHFFGHVLYLIYNSLEIQYNIPNGNYSILYLRSINLINKVEDLRNLIKEEITTIIKKKYPNYIIQNISLLGGNSFLSDGKLLIEYNLSNIINAIVIYKLNEINDNDSSKIVPLNLLPKLTKANYKTNPEYYILCRMSIDELKNISNFKIYNEYGEVQFLNNVNLLGIDLDKECVIEKGCIELKERLNVKRKCILYNFKLDNGNENSMDNFKKVISKNNGVFISYEPKTGRLELDYNEKVN